MLNEVYDVLVIGTGIAGLTTAIYLKENGINVCAITKNADPKESNTNYAQGGIVAYKEDDSKNALMKDILAAGNNYNNKKAVELFVEEAPQMVFDFLIKKAGINFSLKTNGKLDYTEEAAHSTRRILHFEDHTGETIIDGLLKYAKKIKVPILPSHIAIDLITNIHHSTDEQEHYQQREVFGAYVLDIKSGRVKTVFAHNTVVATGGIGDLYQYTTNPPSATGDGLSMAAKAGADIINSEFIQFHPTLFFNKDVKRFLISESLRGEGAKLLDNKKKEFMHKYSKLKELAPRDIVARAIFEEMYKNGVEYMLLDLAHYYKGEMPIKERFSKIYNTCLSAGIDITKEAIPIVPASHFFCGGIKVDLSGRSSIKNLYSVGEASCTGLHGANRLASVSLLEGLYWGRQTALDIKEKIKTKKLDKKRLSYIPEWKYPKNSKEFDLILIYQDRHVMKSTMSNYAGIIRTVKGLERAKADFNYYEHRIIKFYREAKLNRTIIELRNAIVASQIIVNASLHNSKSLGGHFIKKEE